MATDKNIKAPQSASEITVEWVRKVLHDQPSADNIVSIETETDFGSWSLLGDIVRVKLNCKDEECEPKSIIIKFQKDFYNPDREGQIYQLLSEAGVDCIPRLFKTLDNGTLILQDMSPMRPLSEKNLTIAQATEVISIIADINGIFFMDSRIPKNPTVHFTNVINHNMEQSWPIFKSRYREQLGDTAADFEWIWKNSQIVSAQHNSEPTTLNHADVHIENLLFNEDGNGKPFLIDWQLAGQKVLPFDLSGLLVNSLTAEQRHKHEDMFLKQYYELLPDKVKTKYSFDRLLLDYRACVTRSMLGAVMAIGPRFATQPDQLEKADLKAERVIAAVRDLKPVEAIKELEGRNLLKI